MAIYMKYGGIQGDVTESQHANWIELNSLQFGVGRGVSSATGSTEDREASAPSVSEITITKDLDKSSIKLLTEAYQGTGNGDAASVQIDFTRTSQGQLESLLEGGGTVLARAVEVMDRVNRLMSDQDIKEISGTLSDVHAVTSELRDQKKMLGDLDATVKSLNATSEKIGKLTTDADRLVDGDLKRTLANLNDAVSEVKATTVDVRGAVNQIAAPAGEFASTGLPQLGRTVVTLQRAAENLDRLVSEVEQNPRALVGKGAAKELEVKP